MSAPAASWCDRAGGSPTQVRCSDRLAANVARLLATVSLEFYSRILCSRVEFRAGADQAFIWQFWKYFCGIGTQLVSAGADAIFERANDLVVDTEAMALICKKAIPAANTLSFANDARVHHCNYFSQIQNNSFFGALVRALRVCWSRG
jgi:hypothetical protein